MEFERMLARGDGASAAAGVGGTRLQHCDLDYRWVEANISRCSASELGFRFKQYSSSEAVGCVHWQLTLPNLLFGGL
jgi:hypothetical protein